MLCVSTLCAVLCGVLGGCILVLCLVSIFLVVSLLLLIVGGQLAPPVFVLQFVCIMWPLSVVRGRADGVSPVFLGFLSVGAPDWVVLQ